jgi:hypothetical protein
MFITEYLTELAKTVEQHSRTGFITSTELKVDARTEKLGLIKGLIIFIDGSKLFFSEYLDLKYKTEKLSYVYHYQDRNDKMIFRYDNAVHKPAISGIDHKHNQVSIVVSPIPELDLVLEEIIQLLV